jgi:hypothetical protein
MKPLQLKGKKGCKPTVLSQAAAVKIQDLAGGGITVEEVVRMVVSETMGIVKAELKAELAGEAVKHLKMADNHALKAADTLQGVAATLIEWITAEVQKGVRAIKEAKTADEESEKKMKANEAEELKGEPAEACRREQEEIKQELNNIKVKMEEIKNEIGEISMRERDEAREEEAHNNRAENNGERDGVETDKCSREVMINGLQYWKFSNEQRLYYMGATPEEQLAEEIRRLSRGRVMVTEVTMIRSRDNPGWGPVAAKVTVGSTDQKRELYRVVAAIMRAGGRDGHAIARVSFRDSVPKDKLGCMKQLVERGRAMKKDKLIAAFRIVVRGVNCFPMLQVKDQSSRWSFAEE